MGTAKIRKAIRISNAASMNRLIRIARADKRSYRATVEILIDQEYERRHPAGKGQKQEESEETE